MRNIATASTLLVMLACSTGAEQAPPALSPGDVAARVGERTITAGELDARWQQEQPAQHAETIQAMYDGRRAALNALLSEMVIAEAAKAKGETPEAFRASEVAKRVSPVTDADVEQFYNENRSQMQGRSVQDMSALIRRFVEERRRAAALAELVADLRKAGPAVRVFFDAPRRVLAPAAGDPSLGKTDAPVTVIEFSDFQCPFCQRVAPTLKRVREKYGDRVRIVWKDFPLTQSHPQAFGAAMASHCAGDQGKFWEYHDRLFENQRALEPDALKRYASELGLDLATFSSCFDSSKHEARVRGGVDTGTRLGVGSTPTVFVNGRLISGAQPFEVFAAVIDEELERAARQ